MNIDKLQSNPKKGMYAVLELFDEREIHIAIAPNSIELLTGDIRRVREQTNIPLQEVYEIEIVRPVER